MDCTCRSGVRVLGFRDGVDVPELKGDFDMLGLRGGVDEPKLKGDPNVNDSCPGTIHSDLLWCCNSGGDICSLGSHTFHGFSVFDGIFGLNGGIQLLELFLHRGLGGLYKYGSVDIRFDLLFLSVT